MPQFQLNVDFLTEDLKTVSSTLERLVILKQTDGGTPVAWVTIDPFNNNTIEWEENYALYGSQVEVQKGATIHKLSDVAAKPMVSYPFESFGSFDSPIQNKDLVKNQYGILNNYQSLDLLTFGLAQGVQVNGTGFVYKPINAQAVPRNQEATFIPLTEVVVFLDAKIQDGMVITEVKSRSTSIIFGGDVTNVTLQYDSHSGLFVVTSA